MNTASLSSPASAIRTDYQHSPEFRGVKAQPFVGTSIDNSSDDSDNSLSDEAREEAIRQAGLQMQRSYWIYESCGDFAPLGDAHRYRMLMTELIRGRSAQYVAKLEAERGLT